MGNCNCEKELKSLRSLVVKLAHEMDYKNHMLMEMDENNATALETLTKEKDKLLAERSAAISMLVAENTSRERLLSEKSAAITTLMEEKEKLLQETSKTMNSLKEERERMVGERSAVISVLIAQNAEKDKLLKEKSAVIATMIEEKKQLVNETLTPRKKLKVKEERMDYGFADTTTQVEQNAKVYRLIDEKSAAIRNLMVEKDHIVAAYVKELEENKNMKLKNKRLQHDLECQKRELERLVKDQNDMVQKHGIEIEKVKCCLQLPKSEPDMQAKEFKDSGVQSEGQNCSMAGVQQLNDQTMKNLRAEVDSLRKELLEKKEALQDLDLDNQTLIIKEVRSNQELQAARRAAVEGLQAMQRPRMLIGIKRIGEVDLKLIREACSKRSSSGDWDERFGSWKEKSTELCSSWQRDLSNPEWQPFKQEVINGKLTEVIDENDPLLKDLRKEWGEEAYKAVTEAMLGLNEYNASGRYPVSELWNYKEDRRADLGEVIEYVIKQWMTQKNRKSHRSS